MLHRFSGGIVLVSGGSGLQDWLELAGILILCILVIAASYFVTKFIGSKQMGRQNNGNFKIIEVCSVAPGKTLQLVKAGSKFLVLAVTKDSVTKLAELTEEELVPAGKSEPKSAGFSEILAAFSGKKGKPDAGKKTMLQEDSDRENSFDDKDQKNRQ